MSAREAADTSAVPGLEASLELIAGMAQDFATSRDLDATLQQALERITRHIGAEGGSLFLLNGSGDELLCHASTGPVPMTGVRLDPSEGVVGRSVRNNACEMVRDVLNDPSFEPSIDEDTGFTTRSILCAPLSVREQRAFASSAWARSNS
jgi:sigma-B regulation protein RsbU (phosphoserine phosphatase)